MINFPQLEESNVQMDQGLKSKFFPPMYHTEALPVSCFMLNAGGNFFCGEMTAITAGRALLCK
jgi:hypothetical protein